MGYEEILKRAGSVVLHDWPDSDIPDTLTRAGYAVTVYGGPAPDDIFLNELRDGKVVTNRSGVRPTQADLVYSFRPVEELAAIAQQASSIGATAMWCQSGLGADGEDDSHGCWRPAQEAAQVRQIVESAGLTYIGEPYIADAVRSLR